MTGFDAVVLAGGRASRLGRINKPALQVGGVPLLDRVLVAVHAAGRRIVVGPGNDSPAADVVTREEPPGDGPVAAIGAGISYVEAARVVVLAADLPFITPSTVDALLAALTPHVDAVVLIDDTGRDQLLIAAWRTSALRARLAAIGDPAGQPVHRLFDTVATVRATAPTELGQPPPWLDCDTDDDLRRAREWS